MTTRPPMMYAYPAPQPAPEQSDDLSVTFGEPMAPCFSPASEEQIVEALRDIYDPEIPVNIYDLGLIYDLQVAENGDVRIVMTLTAPACPVAGEMPMQVAQRVALLDNTGVVSVALTWDPPWTPERMSEVARVALDMF